MHLVLERVAPMEITCALKYLVVSGPMELDVFNSAMQSFPLSPVSGQMFSSFLTELRYKIEIDSSLYCFEYRFYETVSWNRDLLAYEGA